MISKILKGLIVFGTWFMSNKAAKQLTVDLLRQQAAKTDNTVDDTVVDQIAIRLGVDTEK